MNITDTVSEVAKHLFKKLKGIQCGSTTSKRNCLERDSGDRSLGFAGYVGNSVRSYGNARAHLGKSGQREEKGPGLSHCGQVEKKDSVQATEKEWPERQVADTENVLSWKSKEECSLSKNGDYHLCKC